MARKMTAPIKLVRPTRGRPPKFGRPSRAVTLTLPEDVIATLRSLDDDISRSVVRLVQPIAAHPAARPPAELERHGDSAVIVFRPVKALKDMPGVRLLPLPDGRALVSLEGQLTVHEFELRLRDRIAEGSLDELEGTVLSSIAGILKTARHARNILVHQRSIIVLQSTRRQSRE
jgi:hypothetical protein